MKVSLKLVSLQCHEPGARTKQATFIHENFNCKFNYYGATGLKLPLSRLGLANLVGGSSGTIDQVFWARWKANVGA